MTPYLNSVANQQADFKSSPPDVCPARCASHALGRRDRCVKDRNADGAGSLPIQTHLVLGVAAEHLKPQRVHTQGEDPLLLRLRAIDDRPVGDLLRALVHPDVIGHGGAARLLQEAHGALHVAPHVAHAHAVHLEAALSRIPHGVEHGPPQGVLAHTGDGLGGKAVPHDVRGAALHFLGQLHEVREGVTSHAVWCFPVEAQAAGGAALIELQAEWGGYGEHTLHITGLATRVTLVVGDRTLLLVDGDALHNVLTGCAELHLAEGVAIAVLDRAAGLVHVNHPPRLLD